MKFKFRNDISEYARNLVKNCNLFSFRISNWQPSLRFFRIIRKGNIVFGRVEHDMQIIYYIWCNRPEKTSSNYTEGSTEYFEL